MIRNDETIVFFNSSAWVSADLFAEMGVAGMFRYTDGRGIWSRKEWQCSPSRKFKSLEVPAFLHPNAQQYFMVQISIRRSVRY